MSTKQKFTGISPFYSMGMALTFNLKKGKTPACVPCFTTNTNTQVERACPNIIESTVAVKPWSTLRLFVVTSCQIHLCLCLKMCELLSVYSGDMCVFFLS